MSPTVDLLGVVDLHVHSSPDVRPRYGDDLQVAQEAAEAGMAAILLKCHAFPTADRARLADEHVAGVTVLGGVVLNKPVGGINPSAVEAALAVGGRCVWMPTEDAGHHRRRLGGSGLRATDDHGRVTTEVCDVLDLVAAYDALLATGHLSPAESQAVVSAARDRGVDRILVNHPDAAVVDMPLGLQRELVAAGALMERCFVDTTDKPGSVDLCVLAERMRAVGVAGNVLTSDLGQPHNPRPVDGLAAFIAGFGALGFSDLELRTLTATNPGRLVIQQKETS